MGQTGQLIFTSHLEPTDILALFYLIMNLIFFRFYFLLCTVTGYGDISCLSLRDDEANFKTNRWRPIIF